VDIFFFVFLFTVLHHFLVLTHLSLSLGISVHFVIETQFCTIFGVDPCLCLWGFLYISVIESAIDSYAVSLQGRIFFQDVRGDVIYGARFKNGVRENRVLRKWSRCRCCKVDVSTRVIKSESFQD